MHQLNLTKNALKVKKYTPKTVKHKKWEIFFFSSFLKSKTFTHKNTINNVLKILKKV